MTLAIASIQKDHQRFNALLHCFDRVVADGEEGKAVSLDLLHTMIDYIDSFLDRFHHPKEDEYLFRVLRGRKPEMEPVLNQMREDHYQGRRQLERVRAAVEAYDTEGKAALPGLRAALDEYIELERKHIGVEEREILPQARAVLTHDDWVEINEAFGANRDPLFSHSRQRRFELLFNTIEHRAPPPFGRGEAA
jgi:branched-chain amino acid transport system ATP-binding protein